MMKKISMIIALYLLIFGVHSMYAQESDAKTEAVSVTLAMEDAVQRALEYNYDIKKESYELKKLSIAKSSSWNAIVPTISIGGSLRRANAEPQAPSALLDASPQWSLSRNLTVSTPLGARLAQGVVKMVTPYLQYKAGKISLEQLLVNTAVSVQKVYIDIYIARETLVYLEEKVALEKLKESEAKIAYSKGLMDEFSYLQNQFAVLKSQQAIQNQRSLLQSLTDQMTLLLGYEIGTKLILTDKIETLDTEKVTSALASTSVGGNLSLVALQEQQRMLKLGSISTIFNFFPTISLNWSTAYAFQNDPVADSWFDDTWGDDVGALSFTLALPISEYHPWSASAVTYRQFKQDIDTNKSSIIQTTNSLIGQLESSKRNLEISMTALDIQNRQVEISTRSLELASDSYNAGLMNVRTYQEAKDALYNAQLNQLTYQGDIIKYLLDIQEFTGNLKSKIIKSTKTNSKDRTIK